MIHKIVFWLRAWTWIGQSCLTLCVPAEWEPSRTNNLIPDSFRFFLCPRQLAFDSVMKEKKFLQRTSNNGEWSRKNNIKLVCEHKLKNAVEKCELGSELFHTKIYHFSSPQLRLFSRFLVQEINTKSRTAPSETFYKLFLINSFIWRSQKLISVTVGGQMMTKKLFNLQTFCGFR